MNNNQAKPKKELNLKLKTAYKELQDTELGIVAGGSNIRIPKEGHVHVPTDKYVC